MYTTFLDGPAKGQQLMLKHAPLYLRVVADTSGLLPKWDALDDPADRPQSTETLYAYQRVGEPGYLHIRASGGRGGLYRPATYRFCDPQPTEETLRSAWGAWVHSRTDEEK